MNSQPRNNPSGTISAALPAAPAQAAPPRPFCSCPYMTCDHCRGVTLLELVLVLVLVATMSAVAVSRYSDLSTDAIADRETLKATIRYIRTRAMADIVPWSFQVAGQTGTLRRNGVTTSSITFTTTGVSGGTITFDNRGQPSGTMAFTVANCPSGSVTVTAGTGFIP